MTRMTGPDYAVMCNLMNTHARRHTHTHTQPTQCNATQRTVPLVARGREAPRALRPGHLHSGGKSFVDRNYHQGVAFLSRRRARRAAGHFEQAPPCYDEAGEQAYDRCRCCERERSRSKVFVNVCILFIEINLT